ncbi:Uu.00g144030.m01.CDS01 [Anthostomella pinea]|uniref:Uu.00g144030.m01.CDS01 n=1 Tax=Anthostomella pinea TaxID=933095 RepID=A0AAI8YLP6_9PEZI|nr:Uu.00g144030.m01.CDS01 [Anthostomella pinea]
MPSIAVIAVGLLAAYCATFVYKFVRNYINARKTGLPMIFVPWDQNSFFWMAFSVPLRPHLQKWLPKWIMTEMVTSDPEIAHEILRRPRDFVQHSLMDLFMARFGRNVLTTNGDHWARQRRIVASAINERISKAVFNESVKQTDELLSVVYRGAKDKAAETNGIFDMIKKVTIHVLNGAGMGESVPFENDASLKPKPGYELSYIEAVKAIIYNVAGPIILPEWFLSNYPKFLPGHLNLKTLGHAIHEFPSLTNDMLDQERHRAANSKTGESRSNIMSQLLQASESEGRAEGKKVLSDEEMTGNLFIFTAAGFDTTANTLSYAVALLARYPEWQDWLLEEIDQILPADATNQELDYAAVFPKATRVVAFMFETLRLFTPLVHIAKQTGATPQVIKTSKGTYTIPAYTTTYINCVALHLNADIWRNINLEDTDSASHDDELRFRPTRWLNPSGSSQMHFQPPKGAYLPWSAGPRVCPGQKMAQVEFTAVILILLRRSRAEAVPLPGEDTAQVKHRLDARMKNSVSILTLQMDGVYDATSEDKGLKLRLARRK